jgi:hypothetical protein
MPVVLHQVVLLNIDHAHRAISGWTRLRCSVPAGATSLGLHSRGLMITSVEVDDCAAEFCLDTPALPHLDAGGAKSVADAADKAYWSYLTTVAKSTDARPRRETIKMVLPSPTPTWHSTQLRTAPCGTPALDHRS